ncbi:hypothetical protein WJX72_001924 [[Myrmecia] bisecta]|uniref:AB hydrolase-1 domain-containing protein n=1 Tax=[Myrmecia] bisecta TaxID=41462 RepID=A0AAW1P7F9_9CHLO
MLLEPKDVNFIASCLVTCVPDQWVHQLDAKRPGTEAVVLLIAALLTTGFSQAWHATCLLKQLLLAWATVELAFLVYQRWRYHAINEVVVPGKWDAARMRAMQDRFLTLSGVFGIREFMEGWFKGAPLEQIKRGNVEELVAYAFYAATVDKMTSQKRKSAHAFVGEIEQAWGVQFEEGYDPSLRFMAHCWEPLRVIPKPLAVHLASEAVGMACHLAIQCCGFSKRRCQGINYWVREPQPGEGVMQTPAGPRNMHVRGSAVSKMPAGASGGAPAARRPIMFLHGVGCGLVPYFMFVRGIMNAYPGHPIMLLEVRHVSLRLCLRATDVDDIAHAAAAILHRHGYQEACFVAHSFGTFCVSRICQLHREIVQSVVLIDPVCLLTCFPQLLYSFVYKVPNWRQFSTLLGCMDAARFIVARDLIIAETFCRKFIWHALMLWPHEMPRDALIVLSAKDDLVPGELVKVQLQASNSPARVMYHPTAGHGGFLVDFEWQRQVIENMEAIVGGPSRRVLRKRM